MATDLDAVRTYTASSQRDADAWLADLERDHELTRVEMSTRAAGRVRVVAHLVDAEPAADRPLAIPHQAGGEDRAANQLGATPAKRVVLEGDTETAPDRSAPRGPARCGDCHRPLPPRTGPGRRRRYCSDACRSRAARARNPRPPNCELRAGGWTCDRPAAVMVREPDEHHPTGWAPHGLAVAACEDCAELVEAFAVRQPGVMFVDRQSIAEFLIHRAQTRLTW